MIRKAVKGENICLEKMWELNGTRVFYPAPGAGPDGCARPGVRIISEIRYRQRQVIERSFRHARTPFQQGHQPADRTFRVFGGGGEEGVVQLDGEHDQDDLGKGSRVFELNIADGDALLDDLGQAGFQLGDQMIHVFLVQKSAFLGVCHDGGAVVLA